MSVRALLACVFLLAMVGTLPAIAAHVGPDGQDVASFNAVDEDAPPTPHLPQSAEQPSPDDHIVLVPVNVRRTADGIAAARAEDSTMPPGIDRSVPRPPPSR